MGKYSEDHAGALADVADAGADVTFSHTVPGTLDESTGFSTAPSTTTVAGSAIEEAGDPVQYQALELITSNPATLFFTPTTYGSLPSIGDSVTWNGVVRTVKIIQPLAPDGVAIAATIVVAV